MFVSGVVFCVGSSLCDELYTRSEGSVVWGQLYRVLASLVLELHWRRGDVGGFGSTAS